MEFELCPSGQGSKELRGAHVREPPPPLWCLSAWAMSVVLKQWNLNRAGSPLPPVHPLPAQILLPCIIGEQTGSYPWEDLQKF